MDDAGGSMSASGSIGTSLKKGKAPEEGGGKLKGKNELTKEMQKGVMYQTEDQSQSQAQQTSGQERRRFSVRDASAKNKGTIQNEGGRRQSMSIKNGNKNFRESKLPSSEEKVSDTVNKSQKNEPQPLIGLTPLKTKAALYSKPNIPFVEDDSKSDMNDLASIFQVTNPGIKNKSIFFPRGEDDGKEPFAGYQLIPPSTVPPPPSSVEDEFYEIESIDLEPDEDKLTSYEEEDPSSYLEYEEQSLNEDDTTVEVQKSRQTILRETWEKISNSIRQTFSSPCRVFKLRGYHSEPDLSLPFDEKFELTWAPRPRSRRRQHRTRGDEDMNDGGGKWDELRGLGEKYVSCEDITHISGKEHPDLVRGVLSEIKLRSYAIDEQMKNSWWELYEAERKRFSFFDELFAMGYIVDSLEVLSPPPKDADGKPVTQGEYFVEADEKHYRKKVDYGRVVFKTKHVYTGNFQDWYFEGPGRYCWQDGTVYQGDFSNGLMHGPGSIHWPDGCVYEGRFIYGKRTGWGIFSSADGQYTYAGEWLNGLPHGHGKMWYDPEDDDNDYYEGHWSEGLPEGPGTRQYATGDRYVGNWAKGIRNGYGIMIWLQERQVYKGEWVDGVPHGFGKHIWYLERSHSNSFPTRHVYQGDWVMGRREGIGKMVYPCGSIYEGRWKNGQRHGKGIFVNPAGDILVGLFRAGSILGGSDVPLHAPTYDCDFAGLIEWLMLRFKLPVSAAAVNGEEEQKLVQLTKAYLPYIRKLYHRAGEYSQKYGKHGLYPAYMKKSLNKTDAPTNSNNFHPSFRHEDTNAHHPREYSRLNEPLHMQAKVEKPESLDGVNPVTRFGLWLLLRDCDSVLDEVTMAYYDKIWCETPPLSFQTRHNPFEPVYLWQFLQALIIASVAYFIDIPRLRQHAVDKAQSVVEPVAVSNTTLKGGVSNAEQKRAIIAKQHRLAAQKGAAVMNLSQPPHGSHDDQMTVGKKSKHKGKSPGGKDDVKIDPKKHGNVKKLGDGGGAAAENPTKRNGPLEKDPVEDGGNYEKKRKPSKFPETQMETKSSEKGSEDMKTKLKKKEEETQDTGEVSEPVMNGDTEEEMEMMSSLEDEGNTEEHEVYEPVEKEKRKSMEGKKGEGDAPSQQMKAMSISECFESFLDQKLVPCLRREAGYNLPVMPQPLPALVDMYDAFKALRQRDIIRGKEFFRSALPHLMFPSSKDALWWHRCPEPLSHQIDIDELLGMFRERFNSIEEHLVLEDNFEEKFESEYLGAQAQNSEVTMRLLKLCKDDPTNPECPGSRGESLGGHVPILPVIDSDLALADLREEDEDHAEDLAALVDFTTDGHPFAKNELVPEPFLWADDYKCIPVRRNHKHFENIKSNDVFQVLHQLYPKLCMGKHEKDLQFELIFCDWLWCTSLLAKCSTHRESRDARKGDGDMRPFTNPQSLGVYAHYVKLIKNNPYLSLTPPPDFKPKVRKKATDENEEEEKASDDEKRGVKFL